MLSFFAALNCKEFVGKRKLLFKLNLVLFNATFEDVYIRLEYNNIQGVTALDNFAYVYFLIISLSFFGSSFLQFTHRFLRYNRLLLRLQTIIINITSIAVPQLSREVLIYITKLLKLLELLSCSWDIALNLIVAIGVDFQGLYQKDLLTNIHRNTYVLLVVYESLVDKRIIVKWRLLKIKQEKTLSQRMVSVWHLLRNSTRNFCYTRQTSMVQQTVMLEFIVIKKVSPLQTLLLAKFKNLKLQCRRAIYLD
eukprot:TRINITY_DN751_c2_g1_i2.p1 TRINITY_DN751_c2_g1~~TRINITY_DN751_c2_g1_i2.p1  ORF type:complete len:251 (-),score=-7.11 TRINITY_DN751_c2_g1_i2:414-1166(-)